MTTLYTNIEDILDEVLRQSDEEDAESPGFSSDVSFDSALEDFYERGMDPELDRWEPKDWFIILDT